MRQTMTEYIEREAAEELLSQPITMSMCLTREECLAKRSQRDRDVALLHSIPAADVQPVVLCQNCKNDCHCMIQDFMEDYGITPDDQNNFFCGYGEREEADV